MMVATSSSRVQPSSGGRDFGRSAGQAQPQEGSTSYLKENAPMGLDFTQPSHAGLCCQDTAQGHGSERDLSLGQGRRPAHLGDIPEVDDVGENSIHFQGGSQAAHLPMTLTNTTALGVTALGVTALGLTALGPSTNSSSSANHTDAQTPITSRSSGSSSEQHRLPAAAAAAPVPSSSGSRGPPETTGSLPPPSSAFNRISTQRSSSQSSTPGGKGNVQTSSSRSSATSAGAAAVGEKSAHPLSLVTASKSSGASPLIQSSSSPDLGLHDAPHAAANTTAYGGLSRSSGSSSQQRRNRKSAPTTPLGSNQPLVQMYDLPPNAVDDELRSLTWKVWTLNCRNGL